MAVTRRCQQFMMALTIFLPSAPRNINDNVASKLYGGNNHNSNSCSSISSTLTQILKGTLLCGWMICHVISVFACLMIQDIKITFHVINWCLSSLKCITTEVPFRLAIHIGAQTKNKLGSSGNFAKQSVC